MIKKIIGKFREQEVITVNGTGKCWDQGASQSILFLVKILFPNAFTRGNNIDTLVLFFFYKENSLIVKALSS